MSYLFSDVIDQFDDFFRRQRTLFDPFRQVAVVLNFAMKEKGFRRPGRQVTEETPDWIWVEHLVVCPVLLVACPVHKEIKPLGHRRISDKKIVKRAQWEVTIFFYQKPED